MTVCEVEQNLRFAGTQTGRPSRVKEDLRSQASSHPTDKSLLFVFLSPEPFIFRMICTFIIIKLSMKQGTKHTNAVIYSIYLRLYLKICWEVFFSPLCVYDINKC